MARNNFRAKTSEQKEIYDCFGCLADRYGRWQVWADFITLSACSLDVLDQTQRKRREEEYMSIAKRYSSDEMNKFAEMFAIVINALDRNQAQDFLGELFMSMDLGNEWKGQFFTPYSVCAAMARLNNAREDQQYKLWDTVCDPACGAGATLIAYANECRRKNINYQTSVLFVAQDVDRVAALMCYIQLSLLGCPGYIVIADSLSNPVVGPLLFPGKREGQEIWYTPMFFSEIWTVRKKFEIIQSLITK